MIEEREYTKHKLVNLPDDGDRLRFALVYQAGDDHNCIALMDRENPRTSPVERDANAAFIVRAVNAHKALLEALLASHAALLRLSDEDIEEIDAMPAIVQAAKAIALAEGKQ